jgi:hypothetical protein
MSTLPHPALTPAPRPRHARGLGAGASAHLALHSCHHKPQPEPRPSAAPAAAIDSIDQGGNIARRTLGLNTHRPDHDDHEDLDNDNAAPSCVRRQPRLAPRRRLQQSRRQRP